MGALLVKSLSEVSERN